MALINTSLYWGTTYTDDNNYAEITLGDSTICNWRYGDPHQWQKPVVASYHHGSAHQLISAMILRVYVVHIRPMTNDSIQLRNSPTDHQTLDKPLGILSNLGIPSCTAIIRYDTYIQLYIHNRSQQQKSMLICYMQKCCNTC